MSAALRLVPATAEIESEAKKPEEPLLDSIGGLKFETIAEAQQLFEGYTSLPGKPNPESAKLLPGEYKTVGDRLVGMYFKREHTKESNTPVDLPVKDVILVEKNGDFFQLTEEALNIIRNVNMYSYWVPASYHDHNGRGSHVPAHIVNINNLKQIYTPGYRPKNPETRSWSETKPFALPNGIRKGYNKLIASVLGEAEKIEPVETRAEIYAAKVLDTQWKTEDAQQILSVLNNALLELDKHEVATLLDLLLREPRANRFGDRLRAHFKLLQETLARQTTEKPRDPQWLSNTD